MKRIKDDDNAKEKYGYQDCYKTKFVPPYCFCSDCEYVRVQLQLSGYRCRHTKKYFCTHDGGVSDANAHCELVSKLGTCKVAMRTRGMTKILNQEGE